MHSSVTLFFPRCWLVLFWLEVKDVRDLPDPAAEEQLNNRFLRCPWEIASSGIVPNVKLVLIRTLIWDFLVKNI